MRIRVGVQIQPQQGAYSTMRVAWRKAEEIGADTLFNWDHFFPFLGDLNSEHFECWTLLAAMAEVTERVEVGPLVTCNSYRNPNLLADMARTVDHISNGRLILGIGAGWYERDYEEYGYQLGTPAARVRDLEASLRLIEARFKRLNPPPLRRPIPLLLGGAGERMMLRIVAQHAAIWNFFGEPEMFRHKTGVLDEWCARLGRDRDSIERSCTILPKQIDLADHYLEAGANHLVVTVAGPAYDLRPLEELVTWRDRHRPERAGE
jgi:probable F420-dependent oxidoreductase